MIWKLLYTLPNATSGTDTIATQIQAQVNAFVPLLLLFVFFIVFLGGIGRQKTRTGTADYPMWATVASLSTLMISLIMSTITGLISLDWLVIVVVVTIFSGIWLFLGRRPGEVL